MNTDTTFIDAVETFVTQSAWLEETDLPAIVSLKAMARALDAGDTTPALFNAFGLTYRSLAKRRPDGDGPVDAAEAFLQGL